MGVSRNFLIHGPDQEGQGHQHQVSQDRHASPPLVAQAVVVATDDPARPAVRDAPDLLQGWDDAAQEEDETEAEHETGHHRAPPV